MADVQETPAPRLPATRARQARFGRPVFYVLLVSTLLAALALFAAWGMNSGEDTGPAAPQPVVTQPPPAPAAPTAY
jgi:hypothetical protein